MLVTYIQELLQKHSCVIVPGFGAFLANYKPAFVDMKEHKIYPPSKSVAFNKSLTTNDGILANHIATSTQTSYTEALRIISLEVNEWTQLIKQNKSLLLKDIGRFLVDENQNLIFSPFETKNFLSDSFGLPPISIEPVKRLKDSVASTSEKMAPKRLFRFSVLNVLTALIVLTFLLLTTAVNIFNRDAENVSWASLFPITNYNTIQVDKEDLQPKKKEVVSAPPKYVIVDNVKYPTAIAEDAQTENVQSSMPAAPEPVKPVSTSGKVYISIGAFFSENLTKDIVTKAESEGFSTKIYKDEKLFKVLIVLNKNEVDKKMPLIKSEVNARAWVYCSDCNIP